ncbi:LamG-like jellyroll fold domain-containing protein [Brucella sp. C7-11G]
MIGRYKIIRGVPGSGTNLLPKISMDALDVVLANIKGADNVPRILFDVRPDMFQLAPTGLLAGRDRASRRDIWANRNAQTVIANDPLFNNQPVFNYDVDGAGATSDLVMEGVNLPERSFTVFAVCSYSAALTGAGRIFGLLNSASNATTLQMSKLSSGNLLFGSGSVAATAAYISSGYVPAANRPFVVCGVYDDETKYSHIYLNSVALNDVSDAPLAPTFYDDAVIGFGANGRNTSTGWRGKIARISMFRGALTPAQIASVMAAMKIKYGVVS